MTSILSWLYYGSPEEDASPDPPAEIGTWTIADMHTAMATGDIDTLEKKARKCQLFDSFAEVGKRCCKENTVGPIEGGAVTFLGTLLQLHSSRPKVALFALRLLHCLSPGLSCSQLSMLSAPLCQTLRLAKHIAASFETKPQNMSQAEYDDQAKQAMYAPYYAAFLLLKVSTDGNIPLHPVITSMIAEAIEHRHSPVAQRALSGDEEQLARHEMSLLAAEVKPVCTAILTLGAKKPINSDDETMYSVAEQGMLIMWLRTIAVVGDATHPRDVAVVLCTLMDVLRDRTSLIKKNAAPYDNEEDERALDTRAQRPYPSVAKALAARAIGVGWKARRLPATDTHLVIMASAIATATSSETLEEHQWLVVEVLRSLRYLFDTTCHVTTLNVVSTRILPFVVDAVAQPSNLRSSRLAAIAAHILREAVFLCIHWISVLPRVRCLTQAPEGYDEHAGLRGGTGAEQGGGEHGNDDDMGGDDVDDVDDVIDEEQLKRSASVAWKTQMGTCLWALQTSAVKCCADVEKALALQGDDDVVTPLPIDDASVLSTLQGATIDPAVEAALAEDSTNVLSKAEQLAQAAIQPVNPEDRVSAHKIWFDLLHRVSQKVVASLVIPQKSLFGKELLVHQNKLRAFLKDIVNDFLPATKCISVVSFLLFTVLQNSVEHSHMTGEDDCELPLQFDYAPPILKLLKRVEAVATNCKTTGQILQQASSSGISAYFSSGAQQKNPSHPSPVLNKLCIESVNTTMLKALVFLSSMRCSHKASEVSDEEAEARLMRWQRVARELVHSSFTFLANFHPAYDEACADILQQLCDPVKPAPMEVVVEDLTDDDDAPPEQSVMINTVPIEKPSTKEELAEKRMLVSVAPPESFLLDELYILAATCHRHKGWLYNGEVVQKLTSILDQTSSADLLLTSTPQGLPANPNHTAAGPTVAMVLSSRFDVSMALHRKSDREWARALLFLTTSKKMPKSVFKDILSFCWAALDVKTGDQLLGLLHGNK